MTTRLVGKERYLNVARVLWRELRRLAPLRASPVRTFSRAQLSDIGIEDPALQLRYFNRYLDKSDNREFIRAWMA